MADIKVKRFPAWIIVLVIIGIILASVTGWGMSKYHNLIKLEENISKNTTDLHQQLQNRLDLALNLITITKDHITQKTNLPATITHACTQLSAAIDTNDMVQISANSNTLDSTLSELLAIAETYPDLKTDPNFTNLQKQLISTTNRLNQARQTYNTAVDTFNHDIATFPSNLIANLTNLQTKPPFNPTTPN